MLMRDIHENPLSGTRLMGSLMQPVRTFLEREVLKKFTYPTGFQISRPEWFPILY